MNKETIIILQGVGIVLAAAATFLLTKTPLMSYLQKKKKQVRITRWEQGIEDMRYIRNEHYVLHHHVGVSRNAFFVAHNGGSAPSKETDFFCSVKDETGVDVEGKPLGFQMEYDYGTPIKVDFSYAQMIEDAYMKGYVHYPNTVDMPDCLLKRIYLSEGVAESIVVFYSLDTSTFRFGYASHARYTHEEPFTDKQISEIQLSGNRLRTKFKARLKSDN